MLCELPHVERWQRVVALLVVVSHSLFVIEKYGYNSAIFSVTSHAWTKAIKESYESFPETQSKNSKQTKVAHSNSIQKRHDMLKKSFICQFSCFINLECITLYSIGFYLLFDI